jgi:uncharacterized membrane protein YdjX (TVP38/TMEM64 family)
VNSAPLPFATVLTATVRIIGPMLGILLSWLGLWLGAAVAYGIARAFLRPILHKFLKKRVFFRLDNLAQQYGVLLLIAGWLIPGWPAELVYMASWLCIIIVVTLANRRKKVL